MTDDIHALSSAYALDALPPGERELFEDHLGLCGDCEAEVAAMRETAALLGAAAARRPPARLRGELMAGLARRPPRRSRWGRRRR